MASRIPNRTRSMSRDNMRESELNEAPDMQNEAENDDTALVALDEEDTELALAHGENRAVGSAAAIAVGHRPWTDSLPGWIPGYFRGAIIELSKVTWPTRRETANLTTIVIVFSLVFAAVFGLLDFGYQNALSALINKINP